MVRSGCLARSWRSGRGPMVKIEVWLQTGHDIDRATAELDQNQWPKIQEGDWRQCHRTSNQRQGVVKASSGAKKMLQHHHRKQLQLRNQSWPDCLLLLMSGTVKWEPGPQFGLPVHFRVVSDKGYISLLVLLDLSLRSNPDHFHRNNAQTHRPVLAF